MVETLNLFRNLYRKFKSHRDQPARDDVAAAFRFRYTCFKDLLDSNTQLLNIMADLEEKLQGHQVFGMAYVRSQRRPGGVPRLPHDQKPGCSFRPQLCRSLWGAGEDQRSGSKNIWGKEKKSRKPP